MLFTITATLAYLGLAILGWGGFAGFFSHPALIVLAIALFLLTGATLFTEGNLSSGVREDRANRWVIAAFAVIGLLAAYLPAYTDRKGFWILDGETVRWIGVALFASGGVLRIWPVFLLGRRFSGLVAIQPGHIAGHQQHLPSHPPPQLSGVARQLAGMGARFSIRGRHIADSAFGAAAACPHACRREAAANPVRRRV